MKKESEDIIKPYKYIEENILWSIAAFGYRYSGKLGPKFLHFIKKHSIVLREDVKNDCIQFK